VIMVAHVTTLMTFNGRAVTAGARAGAVVGINMAIERLRGHSVERAPVDQGDLRGSAATEHADAGQAQPTALLVFDEPYAATQHEGLDFEHTPGAAGEPAGEARYVAKNYEDPTRRKEYTDLIGRGVRDGIASA